MFLGVVASGPHCLEHPLRSAPSDHSRDVVGFIPKALVAHAARRDQSLSLIAEAGIASFLSPDAAGLHEAATTKRLDQLDWRMTRMERDLGAAVETLAVFIRFLLTTNPPLPVPAQAAARAKAGDRYEAFVTALSRRLANGPKLRQGIPEDSRLHTTIRDSRRNNSSLRQVVDFGGSFSVCYWD